MTVRTSVTSVPDPDLRPALPEPAPRPPEGYLDAVGGQPLLPVARQAWLAACEQAWGDPARLHRTGRRAGMILDAARASIATSLGIRPDDVYFTSSGPTAVATAVGGLTAWRQGHSRRIVASAVESMAVLEPAGRWADQVDLIPVSGTGRLAVTDLAASLAQPTALVCVQAANAEVGTRQPLREAAGLTRAGRLTMPPPAGVLPG